MDVCRFARGRHWVGSSNEADERILQFCVVNILKVMNTWFEKWQAHLHVGLDASCPTKPSDTIDFVLMRKNHRNFL